MNQLQKRTFFWGPTASLISREEEMLIMRYRGNIDSFLQRTRDFELYMRGESSQVGDVQISRTLIPGKCTSEGTARYKERAVKKLSIPIKNFRRPFPLPPNEGTLDLSTVGLGTYVGKPDDADDFDCYIAAKYLIRSGAVNFVDTAINYRCQKAERTIGAVLNTLLQSEFRTFDGHQIQRDEIFVATKSGYIPDDADNGVPASVLVDQLIEQNKITKEDVAGGIHCMHPNFLEHQLQASKMNLGLETIDLVYLHNTYEQQAHFISDEVYFERLARAFEFYEQKRQAQDIQYYGMATWLCFRAKPEEEKIYLNFQKCVELAQEIGGKDHGFRFAQVPMSVLMPEAFVEKWQGFLPAAATAQEPEQKILVAVANLLQINLIASKPLAEGRVAEIDIPAIKMQNSVSKHLQLIRSLPPRCNISCMVGMKTLSNVKTNFSQVLSQEPLTRDQFLKAMDVNK